VKNNNQVTIEYSTLTASLHYLVKYICKKRTTTIVEKSVV